MLSKKIDQLLRSKMPDAKATLKDYKHDGMHFLLTVTSSEFRDLALVDQHRLVLNALRELFEKGELHAVKVVTLLP